MRTTGYLVISAVLSLLLHLVLWEMAGRIELRAVSYSSEKPPGKPIRILRDPRDMMVNKPLVKQRTPEERKAEQERLDRIAKKMKEVFREAKLATPPKPKLELAGLGRAIMAPKLPRPEKAKAPTAPRPKIIEVAVADLTAEQLARPRRFTAKIDRVNVSGLRYVPSLLSPGMLQAGVGTTYPLSMRMRGLSGSGGLKPGDLPPAREFGRRLVGGKDGFSPVAGGAAFQGLEGDVANVYRPPGMSSPKNGFRALDPYVMVSLTIYEERGGGGYYRADIAANPKSEELWDVPKDILFVIDHSTSISGQKLAQFKASTTEALEYLNPKDRFNVVSFTTVSRSLFPAFTPYSKESMAQAQAYVKGLSRGGMTDVFGSISPYIQKSNGEPADGRPMNVFLMTDGNSTVNIYDDDAFIRTIKEMNPGNVSLYAFSAGRKANRDLLEFLGYHNRGYSLHVADLKSFRSMLVDYISTHSQLILANVKYQAADGLASEAFPKALPHLYREETLSFYGRFPASTKDINVRVSGRGGDGEPYELVFRKPLKECLRGSPELSQHWAAQKVFHLVGQRVLMGTEEAKKPFEKQINALADKFGLMVPY